MPWARFAANGASRFAARAVLTGMPPFPFRRLACRADVFHGAALAPHRITSIAILTIARNAAPLPPATHTLRTRGGIYLIS
ncbi:hypothetical protein WS67_07645 [Burkholderia singularis]|uniref:Uncharacterized protein n=1 Tax=Burkholderia singularis TaxID=1503053 RepID=A0A118DPT4_9BURK|nr:hypothetical protein WS67_07645 [Burkholderia singularis]